MVKDRYHSSSWARFADLIRGEKKPLALSWDQWSDYYDDLQKRKPLRYLITERLLINVKYILFFPYLKYINLKSYVRNRWIDKTHYLKTGLPPGHYHELDERILHSLFNELVDFVEIELAHLSLYNSKKYDFVNGRCIQAAYDYFTWSSALRYDETYGLKPSDPDYNTLTDQAQASIKIKQLYEWWTNIRPCKIKYMESVSAGKHGKKYFNLLHKLKTSLDEEDTKMLIELIEIRRHLWT